eukprot:9643412-Karenia_brevis.AAC.1
MATQQHCCRYGLDEWACCVLLTHFPVCRLEADLERDCWRWHDLLHLTMSPHHHLLLMLMNRLASTAVVLPTVE